jgi:hypothetical protein
VLATAPDASVDPVVLTALVPGSVSTALACVDGPAHQGQDAGYEGEVWWRMW